MYFEVTEQKLVGHKDIKIWDLYSALLNFISTWEGSILPQSLNNSWDVFHDLQSTLGIIWLYIKGLLFNDSSLRFLNSSVHLSRKQRQLIPLLIDSSRVCTTLSLPSPAWYLHCTTCCYCAGLMTSLQTSIASVKVDGHINYISFKCRSCMTQILFFPAKFWKTYWHCGSSSKHSILKCKHWRN